jgi:hypothetical protein
MNQINNNDNQIEKIDDTTLQLFAIQQAFEIAKQIPTKTGEIFPNSIDMGEVLMRDLTEAFVGDVNTAWAQSQFHRHQSIEIIESQKSTARKVFEKFVTEINAILQ